MVNSQLATKPNINCESDDHQLIMVIVWYLFFLWSICALANYKHIEMKPTLGHLWLGLTGSVVHTVRVIIFQMIVYTTAQCTQTVVALRVVCWHSIFIFISLHLFSFYNSLTHRFTILRYKCVAHDSDTWWFSFSQFKWLDVPKVIIEWESYH